MTAIRGYIPPTSERSALGVHSLDRFVLAVPDLAPAQRFYRDFGLDVRAAGNGLALRTAGDDDHVWGTVVEGKRKRLHHLSFGCYADDLPYLRERVEANGAELVDPPAGFDSNGFWLRDPAGLLVEVKVAPKSSPAHKTAGTWSSSPEGLAGSPLRQNAPIVRPRRRTYWCSRPISTRRSISIPAISACACRTVPTWSPFCTASTAATTISSPSPNRPRPACTTAAGT